MNDSQLFGALVFSLHAAGMQQLGKVINPLTGKVEKDLEQVQGTIDMMQMLKRKTEKNLTDEENKLLSSMLYELQMNYVDETGREEKPGTEAPKDSKNDTAEEKDNS